MCAGSHDQTDRTLKEGSTPLQLNIPQIGSPKLKHQAFFLWGSSNYGNDELWETMGASASTSWGSINETQRWSAASRHVWPFVQWNQSGRRSNGNLSSVLRKILTVIDPGCPVPDSCYELHALVRQVLDISWYLIMALWTVGSVLRDLKILRNIALLIFVVGESVSQLQEGLFFDPHDFLSLLPGSSGQNFNSLRLTSKRTFL